jgi:serine/threonine-protein kinase
VSPPARGKRSLLSRQLWEERQVRDRAGLHINLWLSAIAVVALQLTVLKDTKHWLVTLTVAINGIASAIVLAATRRDRRIDPHWLGGLVLIATAATLAASVQLGVLSAVTALFPVIVFYHALDDSPFNAYAGVAIGYLLLAILSLAGVLPLTESVLALAKENPRALIGFTVVLETTFLATYVMARGSRRATRAVMERLDEASRQVRQGDALLTEARADLQRALHGPKLGRYSGVRLSDYAIGELIGRGGMAEVYAATDTRSGAPVAVKILHAHYAVHGEEVARFLREASAAAALSSPHVVRMLCADRAADGTPYLVTELLSGKDLAAVLRERGRLDMEITAGLLMQLGEALEAARLAGVVHRDLKPNNIFRADDGAGNVTWKVLDFGVAAISSESSDLTRGRPVGTPSYMSPEQARGEAVDHRADVFALGAIAFRVLTGQPAFTADEPTSILYQVVHAQPAQPSTLADVHPDVDRALALALAKDRERRFESAMAFAEAFRLARKGALPGSLRDAADALLREQPWSQPGL